MTPIVLFVIGYCIACFVGFLGFVGYALWEYKFKAPDPKLGYSLKDRHIFWPAVFFICMPFVNLIVAITWTAALAYRFYKEAR